MRLTLVNLILRKKPHGYVYRGKYRLVKKVEVPALQERLTELERQEQNMLILRHPYLTVEQSHGHAKAFAKEFKDIKPVAYRNQLERNAKFARRFTWAEQLSHLRVQDAWE